MLSINYESHLKWLIFGWFKFQMFVPCQQILAHDLDFAANVSYFREFVPLFRILISYQFKSIKDITKFLFSSKGAPWHFLEPQTCLHLTQPLKNTSVLCQYAVQMAVYLVTVLIACKSVITNCISFNAFKPQAIISNYLIKRFQRSSFPKIAESRS